MQIVRIEHKDTGYGFFRSRDCQSHDLHLWNLKDYMYERIIKRHKKFPTPNKDKKLRYIDRNEFCAFKTLDILNKWLTKKEIVELSKLGFNVYLIDIDEKNCRIGRNQVVFNKDYINKKTDITELFL